MTLERYAVLLYAFFWVVRINGCIRRGRQPLVRGRGWFFSVPVRPDFYDGAGKKILHRYWLRMLIPFAVDVPVAAAIFLSGRVLLLNYLVLVLCAVIHVNHLFSVDIAEREARPFALEGGEEPVARVLLSLRPRRLRDYTNPKLEWGLALCTLFGFASVYWLRPDLQRLATAGTFLLYVHLGFLLTKSVIVAWRSPLPQSQAAEHMAAREETRKFYLRICDWGRLLVCAATLYWPLSLSIPPAAATRLLSAWLTVLLVIGVVLTVWGEIRRKQLRSLTLRVPPARLPDLLPQVEIARWPICYEPSVPMLVLKGAYGYSVNLANALAYTGAAYIAGFILLLVLLPSHH